jgi:hypothetical protein
VAEVVVREALDGRLREHRAVVERTMRIPVEHDRSPGPKSAGMTETFVP